MSKQASPAAIGGFVVGALTLVVAGVLVFGSGKFFADTVDTVMYFEGDLKGLNKGAAVAFEGVTIGTVTDIGVFVDTKDYTVRSPVVVEIQRDHFRLTGESHLPAKGQAIGALVERKGLRAQLQSESMVTGQRFIQLAFYPNLPPMQVTIDPLTKLPEIPTIPTTIQEVEATVRKALAKFSEMPLEEIVSTLNQTLQGIDRLVNAPEVMESVRALKTTLTEAQQLVRNLDKQITPVTASATEALGSVRGAMGDIGTLARNADSHLMPLTSSLQQTVGTVRAALETAQAMMKNVDGVIAPNSPAGYELVQTLRELSEAARALRGLADYLERNPNSVFFGRNEVKAK
jgi:paraquat-inducible protein B